MSNVLPESIQDFINKNPTFIYEAALFRKMHSDFKLLEILEIDPIAAYKYHEDNKINAIDSVYDLIVNNEHIHKVKGEVILKAELLQEIVEKFTNAKSCGFRSIKSLLSRQPYERLIKIKTHIKSNYELLPISKRLH